MQKRFKEKIQRKYLKICKDRIYHDEGISHQERNIPLPHQRKRQRFRSYTRLSKFEKGSKITYKHQHILNNQTRISND